MRLPVCDTVNASLSVISRVSLGPESTIVWLVIITVVNRGNLHTALSQQLKFNYPITCKFCILKCVKHMQMMSSATFLSLILCCRYFRITITINFNLLQIEDHADCKIILELEIFSALCKEGA